MSSSAAQIHASHWENVFFELVTFEQQELLKYTGPAKATLIPTQLSNKECWYLFACCCKEVTHMCALRDTQEASRRHAGGTHDPQETSRGAWGGPQGSQGIS